MIEAKGVTKSYGLGESKTDVFMTSTRFCDVLSIRRKNGSTLQKIRFWMRHCWSTRKLNGMH